jgi:two-component system phosphate regulon sensor histidine kinase PhoR
MADIPYRILVVDDEERLRQVCRRVLEPLGHVMSEAPDGLRGLEAVERDNPDLVLVDLMMPHMDGMEFLSAAREKHPDLTFVVITGYATLEKAVEAMKQGADDFLAKPFKPQELRLVVDRVLKKVRTVQDMAIEKSRTRVLVNSMTNGVLVIDAAGKVALMNPSLAKLTGWLDSDPTGMHVSKVIPCPEVTQALESIISSQLEDIQPTDCQITLGSEDDPEHLQVHCAPFVDGRGHMVGALAVFDDITALKRLDQLKSEVVSMVAHEIASPLSSVLSQLETILTGVAGELSDKQRHLISRGAARVEGIINLSKDLLDLARIDAGTLGDFAMVDLEALLKEAVDINEAKAGEKGQTMELRLEGDLPLVYGVGRALLEVFMNLVSNAVKYTPDGGNITVSARPLADGVEVAVADTGFGLSPEDQERVFQRFYRVKDAQTRQIVGTGLGLPIVKKVVEDHQGSIMVASEPGKGSSFTVRLPLGSPDGAETPQD